MIDFYVVRLRRTKSNGELVNGKWRGQTWKDGETIFSNYQDARVVRGRVGGDIVPFKESRLYKTVAQEVRDALDMVANLNMSSINEELTDEDMSPLFDVPAK